MTLARLALVLIVTVSMAVAAAPLAAASFSDGMVVFGDSLSDTGFFDSVTQGEAGPPVPGPGYTDGRFSNGPVWVEYLADALGFATPQPPTLGGTNYAFGAARTHTSLAPESEAGLVHMDQQVAMYLDHLTHTPGTSPTNNLFVVWGGANDFMRADPDAPPVDPVASAQNIGQHIQTLYDAGARHFLVGDMPQLGNVPATVHNDAARTQLNAAASAFNAALYQVLLDLESNEGINLFRLPAAEVFDAAWAGEFGFANVDEPAVPNLNPGDTDWGEPAANPEDYMFWDAIHPTTNMHQHIGHAAINAIPEPTTGLLVVSTGMLLLARRNRQAA